MLEGKFVVAVPSFGFERRGAPVASYLRFDEREIRQMTNIYHPDCVLCIDPTVARAVNIFDGIKDGAVLLHMAYEIDPSIRMFSVDTGRRIIGALKILSSL